jgi:hypothetical protein
MRTKLFAVIAAASLLLSGCGPSKKDILAVVNKHALTRQEVLLKAGLYGLKLSGEEEVKDFLNMLINDYLILEQAKKDGVSVAGAELSQEIEGFVPGFSSGDIKKTIKKQGIKYGPWLKDIEEKVIKKKEINSVMKHRIKAGENELKDYFWTHILDFRKARKIRAR